MKVWIYHTVDYIQAPDAEELNKLGEFGWELILSIPLQFEDGRVVYRFYFKSEDVQ